MDKQGEKIGRKADEVKEKAQEFTSEIAEGIKEKIGDVKSKVRGGWESLEEKAKDIKRDIER